MMTEAQKEARIARAKRHVAADLLITGAYVDHGKGCSVGCDALEIVGRDPGANYHRIVADHDGTPEWLEQLRDVIFEGLPADKRSWWHVAVAEPIPTGIDLQPHYHLICAGILDITLEQSATWADEYRDQCVSAIKNVRDLHVAWSAAWSAAESARSVAESARSAAYTKCAELVIRVLSQSQGKG